MYLCREVPPFGKFTKYKLYERHDKKYQFFNCLDDEGTHWKFWIDQRKDYFGAALTESELEKVKAWKKENGYED
jgi:hypothetical protein